jgi:hypothetical protein
MTFNLVGVVARPAARTTILGSAVRLVGRHRTPVAYKSLYSSKRKTSFQMDMTFRDLLRKFHFFCKVMSILTGNFRLVR